MNRRSFMLATLSAPLAVRTAFGSVQAAPSTFITMPLRPEWADLKLESHAIIYEGAVRLPGAVPSDPNSYTEARVRAAVAATPGTRIVLDVESLPWNQPTTVPKMLDILAWARAEAPTVEFGYYDFVPRRDYWRAVRGPADPQYIAWQAENDTLQPLADAVDALYPSIYTFYDDQAGWVTYADANMAEAERMAGGKPIRPFLMPYYHDSNATLRGQPLPQDHMQLELTVVASRGHRAVIWLNPTAPAQFARTNEWCAAVEAFGPYDLAIGEDFRRKRTASSMGAWSYTRFRDCRWPKPWRPTAIFDPASHHLVVEGPVPARIVWPPDTVFI